MPHRRAPTALAAIALCALLAAAAFEDLARETLDELAPQAGATEAAAD